MSRSHRPRSFALAACALIALAGCDSHDTVVAPPQDTVPPAAPQALYSVTGDGKVTLNWVKNTEPDLAGYRVYMGPAYVGPYNPITTTGTTTFVIGGLTNGTTSYFAVAAYDAAGNESDLSVENVYDTPRPAGTHVTLAPQANEPDAASGYDFAAHTVRLSADPATDVYFIVSGGTRLMVVKDAVTDIQDAGYHVLDDLDWAPDAGWSPTGTAELAVGHSYYVWTRTNHYAKFVVTALSDSQVKFDWAYQVDAGNPQLLKTHPRATR